MATPEFQEDIHRELTAAIIGAAIEVHRHLGPGLLESTYESVLEFELRARGHHVLRQVELPVLYKGHRVDAGYRIDLLVDGKVIIELKSIERTAPVHEAQLMTYLRLSGHRVGLLLNFNVPVLRDGITRRVWTPPI